MKSGCSSGSAKMTVPNGSPLAGLAEEENLGATCLPDDSCASSKEPEKAGEHSAGSTAADIDVASRSVAACRLVPRAGGCRYRRRVEVAASLGQRPRRPRLFCGTSL